MGTAKVSTGAPTRLRSFNPVRLADLEYRAWVGYYLRDWPQVLRASVGLVRLGFGMDWFRTLHGAWLVLRANQLWAPQTDNDPDGARRAMECFYALVKREHDERYDPRVAAGLEVEWWRIHREHQRNGSGLDERTLVDALARLYSYAYAAPETSVREAAEQRALAMDLSDRWVREGSDLASPLVDDERAALVRSYAALLAAVNLP